MGGREETEKAGGEEEEMRRGRQGCCRAKLQALPILMPAFASLFPAGANSQCLFKSLHEAQLLNLFCICKGQIHLPFLKVKLLRKPFIFTVILLSNSFFEWGLWSRRS